MIIIENGEIKKDNGLVQMPIDVSGRPASFISGFDNSENIQLAKVTSDGKLMVDANVSVGNITIGDVNIRGWDIGGTVRNIGVTQFSDNSWGINVKNKDLNFLDGKLLEIAHGKSGSSYVPLSVNSSGVLNVNVNNSSLNTNINVTDNILTPITANVPDIWTEIGTIITRGFKTKMLMIINNNPTVPVNINIFGSLDNINYDAVVDSNITLGGGEKYLKDEPRIFTGIKIFAKANTGLSSNITVKAYMINI